MTTGVNFPAANDGARSTTATGRAVIADALRGVDPAAAVETAVAEREGSEAAVPAKTEHRPL